MSLNQHQRRPYRLQVVNAMDLDIVVGLLIGTIAALAWNRPEVRPWRFLFGLMLLGTGILSAAWVAIVLGSVLLASSLRVERILQDRGDPPSQKRGVAVSSRCLCSRQVDDLHSHLGRVSPDGSGHASHRGPEC